MDAEKHVEGFLLGGEDFDLPESVRRLGFGHEHRKGTFDARRGWLSVGRPVTPDCRDRLPAQMSSASTDSPGWFGCSAPTLLRLCTSSLLG